jgi:hypothetical protein
VISKNQFKKLKRSNMKRFLVDKMLFSVSLR